MRRLPVYLVIDTSRSMMGEKIRAVQEGLQMLLTMLRSDPYALETVYLSVITFDTEAEQIVPLTDLVSFQLPQIKAGGWTALGAALSLLSDCIKEEVVTGSKEVKGDWKPIVFLFTDGGASDKIQVGIEALKQVKIANIVACAAGAKAKKAQLLKITPNVLSLSSVDPESIKAFFNWVSASIASVSKKVDLTKRDLNMIPLDNIGVDSFPQI